MWDNELELRCGGDNRVEFVYCCSNPVLKMAPAADNREAQNEPWALVKCHL